MKTRLLKEVRLLLPMWIAALLLATVPAALPTMNNPGFSPTLGFVLGLVVMTVATFGREFSQRTFSMLTVQPVSRERLWWEKVFVLAGFTISVAVTFILFWKFAIQTNAQRDFPVELIALYAVVAAIGGGLLITLVLRQVLAAICLTLLLPIGLMMLASFAAGKWLPGWESGLNQTMLILYSVGSFLLARILFLRAQDVLWTGGAITLPSISGLVFQRQSANTGKRHPILTLTRKEFQLQQVSFLFAGLLVAAQFVALILPRFVDVAPGSLLGTFLDGVSLLWLLMPLMAGCSAVSEERKLGTLEPQLCLPVWRSLQFTVKLLVALTCGVVLGAIVPQVIVDLSQHFGLQIRSNLPMAGSLPSACAGIALVSFYASTLTRQLLHSLSVAAIILVAGVLCFGTAHRLQYGVDQLWSGPLFLLAVGIIALVFALIHSRPTRRFFALLGSIITLLALIIFIERKRVLMFVHFHFLQPFGPPGIRSERQFVLSCWVATVGVTTLLLSLSSWNFRRVHTEFKLWMRNGAVCLGMLATTVLIATGAYHRVWEMVMPFEPTAGPPRLSGSVHPAVAPPGLGSQWFALLPDGRLWTMTEFANEVLSDGAMTGVRLARPSAEYVGGSNWVSIAQTPWELVGVQSDGSLWSVCWWQELDTNGVARPAGIDFWTRDKNARGRPVKTVPVATRIGTDSNWKCVTAGGAHFVALKRDGSIWGWGNNSDGQLGEGPKRFTNGPVQIGRDIDWTTIAARVSTTTAAKSNGSIWKWGGTRPWTEHGIGKSEIGAIPLKLVTMSSPVRSIVSTYYLDVIICEDGSAWAFGQTPPNFFGSGSPSFVSTKPIRLWSDGQWDAFSFLYGYGSTFAIKGDGTLWRQGRPDGSMMDWKPDPRRVGDRSDWIATSMDGEAILVLAKDGALCIFGKPWRQETDLLLPPRRVTWSANVLDAER